MRLKVGYVTVKTFKLKTISIIMTWYLCKSYKVICFYEKTYIVIIFLLATEQQIHFWYLKFKEYVKYNVFKKISFLRSLVYVSLLSILYFL